MSWVCTAPPQVGVISATPQATSQACTAQLILRTTSLAAVEAAMNTKGGASWVAFGLFGGGARNPRKLASAIYTEKDTQATPQSAHK
jgi:hypothetical protein